MNERPGNDLKLHAVDPLMKRLRVIYLRNNIFITRIKTVWRIL